MQSDALRYAYRLLSYRGRSRKELEERLRRKGFDRVDIDGAMERLTALGYLDDMALAESLKRVAMDAKLLGREGARQFLKMRGIGRQETEAAISDYDELEAAVKFVRKKMRTMKPDEGFMRRLSASLRRRGYSFVTIRKAIKANEEEI